MKLERPDPRIGAIATDVDVRSPAHLLAKVPPHKSLFNAPADARPFTGALAHAVDDHREELDEVIERHSEGWTLDRIAPLERAIMRIALLEMVHPDAAPGDVPIPPEGAISEAVETAKRFCGAEAPAFINGILGTVLRERVSGASPADAAS